MDVPRPVASGVYARFILVQPVAFDVHCDQESPFQQLGSPPMVLSVLYKVRCDVFSIGTPVYIHISCYVLCQPLFWVAMYVLNANNEPRRDFQQESHECSGVRLCKQPSEE